jgi:hypothetical protein
MRKANFEDLPQFTALEHSGIQPRVLLCCCAPPYSDDDTVMTGR